MSTWPTEVKTLFMAATSSILLEPSYAEKLKAHINRLWLEHTPEAVILHEISLLAEAGGR